MHNDNERTLQGIYRVLDRWRAPAVARHLVRHAVMSEESARTRPFPADLAPALLRALRSRGIERLYTHQADALDLARRGRDVVVTTPTASGKTLCYNGPVFQALLEDPQARALYLFPTKALARDQMEEARLLAAATGESIGVAVYDGDTPVDQRRAARRKARLLATNPEMLHAGILPHHPGWAELLSGLRYVVLDELHTYRGVFGSHLAHVLRRLRRLCRFHGSDPVFLCTSATIANPAELAERLVGRPFELVAESGAPRGERHLLIFNPPVLDAALGVRENYLTAATRLTLDLVEGELSSLVFCRSRLAVEVLLRTLRESLESADGSSSEVLERVRGYRGGYLPERRRAVEQALRAGRTDVVVTTSALELGIDIGGLDAVVVAGWPGSRAATWQRAGRAGRRRTPSLAILVASSEPVDQYVAGEPDYLLGEGPEHARVDPDNPLILVPHLKCAAYELPFAPQEAYGHLDAQETAETLDCLAEAGVLHGRGGRYHYVGDAFPAQEVQLRGPLDENFLVVDEPTGTILAEVDYQDAPQELHDQAIYQLEGQQYEVRRLDHDARKAHVTRAQVDYYTDALTQTRVRVLETHEAVEAAAWGEVHVLQRVVGFKKIKLHTQENVGYGEVCQPDREMHSMALWLTTSVEAMARVPASPGEWAEASLAAAYALHSTAALLLMSEPRDLGRAVGDARSGWFAVSGRRSRGSYQRPGEGQDLLEGTVPTIFLFDRYPGGTGLAERLYDERAELLSRAHAMIARCGCARGCPACIGPGGSPGAKRLARGLLELLLHGGDARGVPAAEARQSRGSGGERTARPGGEGERSWR